MIGANLINYLDDIDTPTANLLLIKNTLEQHHLDNWGEVCKCKLIKLPPHNALKMSQKAMAYIASHSLDP